MSRQFNSPVQSNKSPQLSHDSKMLASALFAVFGLFFTGFGIFDFSLRAWSKTGFCAIGLGLLFIVSALVFLRKKSPQENNLQYFDFNGVELRSITIDEETLFYANDIFIALEIKDKIQVRRTLLTLRENIKTINGENFLSNDGVMSLIAKKQSRTALSLRKYIIEITS